MMSDGSFRLQMPPPPPQQQQQQIPGQFMSQPPHQQLQAPPGSYLHQPPQQLLPGGPPPQPPLAMISQPPFSGLQSVQQPQLHSAGGPGPGHVGTGSSNLGGQVPTAGSGPNAASGSSAANTSTSSISSSVAGQAAGDVSNNFHPITRAKTLMVDLKQAIQVLMKTAADVTKEHALSDNAMTAGGDAPTPNAPASEPEELRKSLELFDTVCDQIESNFMMIQDLHREQNACDRYTPANVLPGGQKITDDQAQQADIVQGRPIMSYKEYDDLTRVQAQFASSIRDSFSEFSRMLD